MQEQLSAGLMRYYDGLRAKYRQHDSKMAAEKAKLLEVCDSSLSSDQDDETFKIKVKKTRLSKLIAKALQKRIDKTRDGMIEDRDVNYDKQLRYNIIGPLKLGRENALGEAIPYQLNIIDRDMLSQAADHLVV